MYKVTDKDGDSVYFNEKSCGRSFWGDRDIPLENAKKYANKVGGTIYVKNHRPKPAPRWGGFRLTSSQ